MAQRKQSTDENGNPINQPMDYSHLPSVSDVANVRGSSEIKYGLPDVQNRNLVMTEASLEAGTFGTYAQMTLLDPATGEEKTVTSGSTVILSQVSALINTNNIPCRVVVRKMGKTWTLN